MKLLVGLLKGAVIGAIIGYAVTTAHVTLAAWLICGLVGVAIGLLVGRPIWALITDKDATIVAALIKSVVGFGVGVGLWAILEKAWGPPANLLVVANIDVLHFMPAITGAIGALYGAFVEMDDAAGMGQGAGQQKVGASANVASGRSNKR